MTTNGRLLAVAVLATSVIPAAADLKIVTRTTVSNGSWFVTRYLQGQRQRKEIGAANWKDSSVKLDQCDARKQIYLNLDARLFDVTTLGPDGRFINTDRSRKYTGPTYSYIITTEDTGKRAKFFGFDAWHVRDTIVTTTSVAPVPVKMVYEYWYIDLKVPTEGCFFTPADGRAALVAAYPQNKLKRIGSAKRGFPVLTRTFGTTENNHPYEIVDEVTELSTVPLDPQLFEIPKDFRPALKLGDRVYRNRANTPINRMGAAMGVAWDVLWRGVAKVIF